MLSVSLAPIPGGSRNPFTPDEDSRLRELVGQFGENNWESVAAAMGNRNVRQCRERWFCFVSNVVRKGEWSTEEDAILLEKYRQYGSKWKFFETFLPGRKCYAIRNRLHLLLRRMEALGHSRFNAAAPFGRVPVGPCAVARAPAVARLERPAVPLEESSDPDPVLDFDPTDGPLDDLDWLASFA